MSTIPPAPPLPSTSGRSAFQRITQSFTQRPSAPASHDTANLKPVPSLTSQQFSFTIRGPGEFACFDINRDRTHAVIAGRDCLRIIRINAQSADEETDCYQIIQNRDRQNQVRNRESLDILDVKWSHGEYSKFIAAATTNGKVLIYDLGRPGLEVARLHQHSHQVHRVAFNPHGGRLLLSASQDGSILLWDLREANPQVKSFRAKHRFNVSNDGLRDVRWNPQDAVEFAVATNDGLVQKWSYRDSTKPLLSIKAHDTYCTAIDWHPDGKHLLSAGQDKHLKIWDFSNDDRRQKAKYTIRTPYALTNARWRYSSNQIKSGSIQCSQVAASYYGRYPFIHVWDFARPYMPRHEISLWSTYPDALLWASDRLLWTLNKEGQFDQVDLSYVPRMIDRRPPSAFAISPTGEICVFNHQSISKRQSSEIEDLRSPTDEDNLFDSFTDRLDSDPVVDDGQLGPLYRQHLRASNYKSNKSTASTPPSNTDPEIQKVTRLNETISRNSQNDYKSQVAFRGPLDGTINPISFSYLAQKYKSESLPIEITVQNFLNIEKIFRQNANYAQKTASYRTAQTWRLLAVIFTNELKYRANENRKLRLQKWNKILKPVKQNTVDKLKLSTLSPLLAHNPAIQALQKGGQSSPKIPHDSTSNVTTPQAKPLSHLIHERKFNPAPTLPDPAHDEISLPPSLIHRHGDKDIINITQSSFESDQSSQEAVIFAEPDSMNYSTSNNYNDYSNYNNYNIHNNHSTNSPMAIPRHSHPGIRRHDSDDSSAMFSMSASSQHSMSGPESLTILRSQFSNMGRIPEHDLHNGTNADRSAGATISLIEKSNSGVSGWSRNRASFLTSSSEFESESRSLDNQPLMSSQLNLEASQTIVPGEDYSVKPYTIEEGLILQDFEAAILQMQMQSAVDSITTKHALLQLLHFYTAQVPNAQAIYHMANTLIPILSKHNVNDLNERISPLGINMSQSDSILSMYYKQLHSLKIYNPAIQLARRSYKRFPHLFDTTSRQIGFICLGCQKPINSPSKARCENCRKRQSPCPICWQKYPPAKRAKRSRKFPSHSHDESITYSTTVQPILETPQPVEVENKDGEDVNPTDDQQPKQQQSHTLPPPRLIPILWQSCLTCGHGAHAACLQALQNDPRLGGKCPTDGCLCDCIPGTWRNQLNREAAALAEARRRESRRDVGVRKDNLRVKDSAAVKGAGRLLGEGERRVVFID